MQQKKEKRRKLLIMLPVFLPPLVLLGFLLFGSSKKDKDKIPLAKNESAFNTNLPSANVKEAGKNKLEIYMQAQKDSAKRKDELLNDPYEKKWFDPAPPVEVQQERLEKTRTVAMKQGIDPNEKKVNERLDKLFKELNRPEIPGPYTNETVQAKSNMPTSDIPQLEELMASLKNPESVHDPEMNRIESMLERILDIQHPERVNARLAQKKDTVKSSVLPLTTQPINEENSGNGFYGFQEAFPLSVIQDNTTILAIVPDDQVVQDGSTIKFRLLQDVFVKNVHIPKGNTISGICEIGNERVNVQLKDITYKNIIYPVSLIAYDTDGLLGINVPGAINRDIAKNGLGQTVQNMDVYSVNPSVAAQAAQAGIQTAKSLLSRNVKKVQATIKAGHKVLLKIASSN